MSTSTSDVSEIMEATSSRPAPAPSGPQLASADDRAARRDIARERFFAGETITLDEIRRRRGQQ